MVNAHALAGKDELEAGAAMRESELELKLANAKLGALRVSNGAENEFTVVAPRDGVVVEKNVLAAQQITPHDALLEIADTSVVWAVAEVFETQAQGIAPGTRARLTRAELPGFAAEVPVDLVSSVVDPSLHTVTARAIVPNPDHTLRPNTYVEMRFEQPVAAGAVEVASSAIVSEGSAKYVYVEHGKGHFERRRVNAGSSSGNRIVVESGIAVGERVVEEGSALLDNARVLAN
jgi:RND family efflux transporter MFP subunit